ncbi:NUDIX domain-containing protein [Streptomyces olivoreticuli]
MTGPFTLNRLDELVTRSHSDGITDLAAAALIEHDGRFLLGEAVIPDLDVPRGWELPTGRVLPGETVADGLHRILSQHYGYSDTQITRFLGFNDDNGTGTRVFVFAVTTGHPDSICWSGHTGHRWIDNIAISDTVTDIDHLLRAYCAHDPG